MPHHEERPASALAHGPAKPSDIERVRREMARAEAQDETREPVVERAIDDMAAACQAMRNDLNQIERAIRPNAGDEVRPRGRQRSA